MALTSRGRREHAGELPGRVVNRVTSERRVSPKLKAFVQEAWVAGKEEVCARGAVSAAATLLGPYGKGSRTTFLRSLRKRVRNRSRVAAAVMIPPSEVRFVEKSAFWSGGAGTNSA